MYGVPCERWSVIQRATHHAHPHYTGSTGANEIGTRMPGAETTGYSLTVSEMAALTYGDDASCGGGGGGGAAEDDSSRLPASTRTLPSA